VINPVSGGKRKQNLETAIHQFFKPFPHQVEFFLMDGKNDAASLTHWITSWKPDRVIAVGGDGTVSLVAKQLLGSQVAMGILPAGSANGMARELDINNSIDDALRIVTGGVVKRADVIRLNNEFYCLHLSDIGLNAKIIKHFEDRNIRGFIGYGAALLKSLWGKERMQLTIETRNREIRRDALMVVLANARQYGTGAVINPYGNLYDGLFEVVIVKKLAVTQLLKMLFRAKRFNPKNVEVFHTRHVAIETKHPVHFQVDGEYLGKLNRVEATIEAAQLNLLLPQGA
ncbi:MAG TPA: YegS/Rv2252/BmrU family lipid kinase, partial [Chitinophagaceae bacterium]